MSSPIHGDQHFIRRINTGLVLDTLRRHSTLSRANVASALGLSRPTAANIINHMIELGMVRETALQKSVMGRPGVMLELNREGCAAIGLHFGYDALSIVLTDFLATILWRKQRPIPQDEDISVTLEHAEGMIIEALAEVSRRKLRCPGIGVGFVGMFDMIREMVICAINRDWRGIQPLRKWKERIDRPFFLDGSSNAAAIGEYYFGEFHDVQNMICLTSAGAGIGAGFLIGGRLYTGATGYAGEAGHMQMDPNGRQCKCGRRGCWETILGPKALVLNMREALARNRRSLVRDRVEGNLDAITFKIILESARAGDAIAGQVVRQAGEALGQGVLNLINLFNPELVLVGGALSQANDLLLPIAQEVLAESSLIQYHDVKLAASTFGEDIQAVGAAALVLDSVLRDPLTIQNVPASGEKYEAMAAAKDA